MIKQLETCELQRLGLDVNTVGIELEPRISPTVHVEHELHTRIELL